MLVAYYGLQTKLGNVGDHRQIDNEFVDGHCRLSVVYKQSKAALLVCRCRAQVCDRLSRIIDEIFIVALSVCRCRA